MPLIATIYLLVYAAMIAASLAYALSLDGHSKTHILGDLFATTGWVVLAVAYWVPKVQSALGISGAVLFAACLGWTFLSIEPSVRLLLRNMPEAGSRGIYIATIASLVAAAPAMWWGLRVCLGALSV
ncbi:MAG: hypothetical protein ACKVPY_02630 [Paracoccaceae bacterium]